MNGHQDSDVLGRYTLPPAPKPDKRDAYIARLEADLLECLEYFKDKYDVCDGDYGEPSPNTEMQLGTMIQRTLYGEGNF